MRGEFGDFVNSMRKGRADNGGDILLRDLAEKLGWSVSYLSDILKGRRNPPEMKHLEIIASVLKLTPEEREQMLDLAGRERSEAAPDLPDYIMDEELPHVRVALRRAKQSRVGDDFWRAIAEHIEEYNVRLAKGMPREKETDCLVNEVRNFFDKKNIDKQGDVNE